MNIRDFVSLNDRLIDGFGGGNFNSAGASFCIGYGSGLAYVDCGITGHGDGDAVGCRFELLTGRGDNDCMARR